MARTLLLLKSPSDLTLCLESVQISGGTEETPPEWLSWPSASCPHLPITLWGLILLICINGFFVLLFVDRWIIEETDPRHRLAS